MSMALHYWMQYAHHCRVPPRLRNDLYCVEWHVKLYCTDIHTCVIPHLLSPCAKNPSRGLISRRVTEKKNRWSHKKMTSHLFAMKCAPNAFFAKLAVILSHGLNQLWQILGRLFQGFSFYKYRKTSLSITYGNMTHRKQKTWWTVVLR